jgi:hypothetical protein
MFISLYWWRKQIKKVYFCPLLHGNDCFLSLSQVLGKFSRTLGKASSGTFSLSLSLSASTIAYNAWIASFSVLNDANNGERGLTQPRTATIHPFYVILPDYGSESESFLFSDHHSAVFHLLSAYTHTHTHSRARIRMARILMSANNAFLRKFISYDFTITFSLAHKNDKFIPLSPLSPWKGCNFSFSHTIHSLPLSFKLLSKNECAQEDGEDERKFASRLD